MNLHSPSNFEQLGWFEQINEWLEIVVEQYGYLGIFFVSLLGAASIVIPIPYTIFIFTAGSLHVLDPFLIAISGATGSAIGELFGYFLGYYGRDVVGEERQRKMNYVLRVFSRYGAVSIFLLALTPLPDDLLFIPLGMMRYNLLKVIVPSFVGKLLMCSILAYGGYLSIGFVGSIFGDGGPYTVVLSVILLLIIIVAMLKVDWERVFPLREERNGKGPQEVKRCPLAISRVLSTEHRTPLP